MKLAVRDDADTEGRLLLVDPPLTRVIEARACTTLREAVGNWGAVGEELRAEYAALASGDPHRIAEFDLDALRAPLPTAPLIEAPAPEGAAVVDGLAADVAVVVDALERGADEGAAARAILLVTLAMAAPVAGRATGWRFAAVATTPTALGEAWDGMRIRGELALENDDGGTALPLTVDVVERIVAAARDRALAPGTVIAPGPPPAPGVDPRTASSADMRDGLGRSIFGPVRLVG